MQKIGHILDVENTLYTAQELRKTNDDGSNPRMVTMM